MKPNFIVAGSSAAGTSFLTAAITQHPEIYLPKKMRPEPHYFYKSWEYEKPASYYEEKYFSGVENEKAIGERSSSYMFGEQVAERMFRYCPTLKFIFMLRNPIERAYANYRYTALQGLEDCTFDEALRNEEQRVRDQEGIWKEIQPYNYTGRGYYHEQISRFTRYFDKDQLLLMKSEGVSSDPSQCFIQTFEFLDVDPGFQPVIPPTFTSLSVIDPARQKVFRAHFAERFDLVIEAIRKHEPTDCYAETPDDRATIEALRDNMSDAKEPMSDWARSYLRELFADELAKLAVMLPFDISDWK